MNTIKEDQRVVNRRKDRSSSIFKLNFEGKYRYEGEGKAGSGENIEKTNTVTSSSKDSISGMGD